MGKFTSDYRSYTILNNKVSTIKSKVDLTKINELVLQD